MHVCSSFDVSFLIAQKFLFIPLEVNRQVPLSLSPYLHLSHNLSRNLSHNPSGSLLSNLLHLQLLPRDIVTGALLEIVQIQYAMATWKEVIGVTTANLNVWHVEENGVQMEAQRLLHPTQFLHRHLLPELLPRAWQRLQDIGIAVEAHAAVLTSPSKAMIPDQLIVIGRFNEWSAMNFQKNTLLLSKYASSNSTATQCLKLPPIICMALNSMELPQFLQFFSTQTIGAPGVERDVESAGRLLVLPTSMTKILHQLLLS